ncbi:MAG: hypothetical protein MJK15_02965 [Colwellia sp.]|nr:hypothetical protein [Colwellia sp.]
MLVDYKSADRFDFFCTGLSTFCHGARSQLHQVKRAYTVVSSTWDTELTKINEQMKSAIKQANNKDEQSYIGESFSLDFAEVYEYEVMHRHSILLTTQNVLEHLLDELCQLVAYTMDSQIKHTDLKDSGIARALKYLTKVAKFDLSSIQTERQKISQTQQIRNLIVHAGGKLPDDENNKIVKLVANSDYFNGLSGRYITIQPEFISCYIDTLISFFDKLDKEVQTFMSRVL